MRALLLIPILAATLHAGHHFRETTVNHLENLEEITQIWIQGDLLRVEEGSGGWLFFHDARAGAFSVYDRESNRVSRVTEEDIQNMKGQVKQQMAATGVTQQDLANAQDMLQDALKEARQHMSAEDRAAMDQYLGGGGGIPGMAGLGTMGEVAGSDPTWQKVDENVDVNGLSCAHYRATLGDALSQEVWSTTPGELGLGAAEGHLIQSMEEFMARIGEEMEESDYEGLPVRQVHYQNGMKQSTSTLQKVGESELEEAFLRPPADAKTVSIMDLMMER